jgi:YD repeat-containing protein
MPLFANTNPVDPAAVSLDSEQAMLIRVLFYPDGKKREFDYDDDGQLRGIDHGDGNLWLKSPNEANGWMVLSEEMTSPPETCLFHVKLNQSTGDLSYQTETMSICETPSGEKISELLRSHDSLDE